MKQKNVFIIGSKGIPAKYGGFETFVDKLTEQLQGEQSIKFHVSCLSDNSDEYLHNGARCFNVPIPEIGSAKAVLYDIKSLKRCIDYIETNKLDNSIIYILACRIGPFIGRYKKRLNKLGVKLFVNPDGQEWKRSKWNQAIRAYWKISERLMVKHANLLICDSKEIERQIKNNYRKYEPKTTFISYGADLESSTLGNDSEKLQSWFREKGITPDNYYLIVGRFVPENNYELIIKEHIKSKSNKDLAIITNVEQNDFFKQLDLNTKFSQDERIKFVGTVYDQELLKKIRENAFAYVHGHEVGGTNPSLLEALASTRVNLLLDVAFNKEVGENGALYFSKKEGDLSSLIEKVDKLKPEQVEELEKKAKHRILEHYTWKAIAKKYKLIF